MWKDANPNPCGRYVGDCVIRAMAILFDMTWEQAYVELSILGLMECDMPSANHVWGLYLEKRGYKPFSVPANSVTVSSFASLHPNGRYLLSTGSHVVAVINGDYYDAWDSGQEIISTVWKE